MQRREARCRGKAKERAALISSYTDTKAGFLSEKKHESPRQGNDMARQRPPEWQQHSLLCALLRPGQGDGREADHAGNGRAPQKLVVLGLMDL
jgi:hypothetical protein